jgi:DNA-binding CsgD family transcriptional regulator/ArsR family metal-binding transcriptional regulator
MDGHEIAKDGTMLVTGYSDLSLTRGGILQDLSSEPIWGAYFRLDNDIREVFPFINGTVAKARYQLRPLHVRFLYKEVACTLYPKEAMAAPLRGRDHAVGFIDDLIVFLNDLYDRRHERTPSHKLYQRPVSVVEIVKMLPLTNCRRCGYPTCMAFAAAIRKGKARPEDCPDFAEPISVCKIYPVFGPDGALESTLSIESGHLPMAADEDDAAPQQIAALETTQADEGGRAPLYDRYGIRIQYDLSPREIQVLRYLAEGASNPEISEALNISPHTVKSHVIHIFNKINVNDRTQAAVWAVQNKVV